MKRFCFLLLIIVSSVRMVSAQEIVTSQEEEMVFVTVEEQPEFPGGVQALLNYLSQNIQYPDESRANGSQGRVFVRFVVDDDGSVGGCEVIRSSGDILLDKEAVRVVESMPAWKPGSISGIPVRVYYVLPISFKLADPDPTEEEKKN